MNVKTADWVKNWLVGFLFLLLAMIAVGGVTRLTRSGLSIVEWRPFTGIIPPLSEEAWQAQFQLYQKSPEYLQINSGFTLEDYKNIFLWEYLHRVLGRFIFFYALFPGLYFWRKKLLPGSRVTLFCGLVAAQGLVGWLMVKSGLNQAPEVSPYMLALHFFSALLVLVTVFYNWAARVQPEGRIHSITPKLWRWLCVWGGAFAIQLFYGCMTSGFKAGFSFNTYPAMGGQFFPPGGLIRSPAWINFLQNPSTIQWTHRWIGMSLLVSSLMIGYEIYKQNSLRNQTLRTALSLLLGVASVQVVLGILNILWIVPIPLAVVHQSVATLLVLSYFNLVFRFGPSL